MEGWLYIGDFVVGVVLVIEVGGIRLRDFEEVIVGLLVKFL